MYLLFMIKARIRWCTCSVENILTLGKLVFDISNLLSYIQKKFQAMSSLAQLSREISIEHPSVGLASLAQLHLSATALSLAMVSVLVWT